MFSAIFKDLTTLEKKRFNYSAVSASSFRISSFSMRCMFPLNETLFMKKGFFYFPKSLVGYNRYIEIVKNNFFYKVWSNNFSASYCEWFGLNNYFFNDACVFKTLKNVSPNCRHVFICDEDKIFWRSVLKDSELNFL